PYCDVNTAIATNKAYVKVQGSTTSYPQSSATGTGTVSVMIVGPGKAATPTALFKPASAAAVSISSTGGSATIVLDGLELIGESAPARAGVFCSAGVAPATITVRDSYIHASGGLGIDASGGCALTVQRSRISANASGGVS